MAIVIIESPSLTSDQKTRIGERVITALQHEGLAPGSVVVLFQPERGDIYLDGLLIKAETALSAPAPVTAPAPPKPVPPAPAADGSTENR